METAPAVTLLSPAGKIPPPIENVSAAPTGAALTFMDAVSWAGCFRPGLNGLRWRERGFHLGFGGAGLIRFSQVASKPDFAAGAVFSDGLLVTFLVGRKAVALCICRGGGGRPRRGTSCTAGARRCCRGGSPVRNLRGPSRRTIVVTVDADQVVAPEGHVAAFDEAGGITASGRGMP